MGIKNLITRDTVVIHLLESSIDDKYMADETGIPLDIIECYNSWFHQNGIWYFYKRFYNSYFDSELPEEIKFINELIGENLSGKLDIPSIHYMIARLKDKIGLISENFVIKNQRYYFMKDLGIRSQFYNDSNLASIRKLCKNDGNYRELLSEIFKLVAIDIFMAQDDRNISNIQFTKKEGELHLAPLYDFEDSYREPLLNKYSSALLGLDLNDIEKYPLLSKYLDYLFELRIRRVLEEIEDERKILIPLEIKNRYDKYEEDRKKILKK